jgi:hypothetical protein
MKKVGMHLILFGPHNRACGPCLPIKNMIPFHDDLLLMEATD